jgi:hypothetical protein
VTRLDVSRGRHRKWGRGALIGGIVGGVLGLGLSVAWAASDCPSISGSTGCDGERPGLIIAASTAVSGIGFGIIGAGIGALFKTDRWEEVPLDRLSVSFAPKRDGRFALGLTYRF